jgi:signal transduction histidine kinase
VTGRSGRGAAAGADSADGAGGAGPAPGRGWARLSSRQWANLILSAMAVIIVAAGVLGWYVLRSSSMAADRLVDRNSPALMSAQSLQAALLNQETGVRGYLLSGNRDSLRPYRDGLAAEAAAAGRLRTLISGPDQAADLDAAELQAARWRRDFAEPVVAALDRAGPSAVDAAQVQRGKEYFDAVRVPLAALGDHLSVARAAARAQVRSAERWRNLIFAVILATFLAGGAVLAAWLRIGILRPLSRLGAATRRAASEDFGQRIAAGGPTDLVELGEDVEALRRRAVAELAKAEAGHLRVAEQAAELRRSNAELEQFAYVASHDLQEPLRKVSSFCQMLERRYGDVLDERGRQYVEFAVDAAKRMQVLINDLLTFSRLGRVNDRTQPVDLADALAQALANLSTRLEENDAEVEHDPLPTVLGDPTLLTMLLQNLVGNAVKFRAEDRPPRIRLTAERAAQEWRLSVQDNGIGVDPQFADKIFVIFQRLHGRDEYGGTGIGLALAKKIVEYHGGRIWLDPDYHGGARFAFTLPVTAVDAEAADLDPTRQGVATP